MGYVYTQSHTTSVKSVENIWYMVENLLELVGKYCQSYVDDTGKQEKYAPVCCITVDQGVYLN